MCGKVKWKKSEITSHVHLYHKICSSSVMACWKVTQSWKLSLQSNIYPQMISQKKELVIVYKQCSNYYKIMGSYVIEQLSSNSFVFHSFALFHSSNGYSNSFVHSVYYFLLCFMDCCSVWDSEMNRSIH